MLYAAADVSSGFDVLAMGMTVGQSRAGAWGLAGLLGLIACLALAACGGGAASVVAPPVVESRAAAVVVDAALPVVTRLPQEGWVEVTAEVVASEDEAPADASRRARVVAHRAAVDEVAGTSVTAGTLRFIHETDKASSELAQMLAVTRSEAFVVDQVPGPDRVLPLSSGRGYRMQVSLKARVVDRRQNADPGFTVSVDLGRRRFRDGEDVTMSITSTRAARLYVVDVTDDGAVVLLPNAHQPDTRVPAGGTLRFPGTELSARGVGLKAQVPKGQSRSIETLVVVAVKGDAQLPSLQPTEGIFRVEEARGAVRLLGDITAPLFKLPVSEWTVMQVPYEVWSR